MKRKNIKNLIKEYFFLNPTLRLRVRQVERRVKVPLPSVIRYTKELKQESILKISEIAGVVTYSADRGSPQFRLEKRLFNLQQMFSCKLIDYMIQQLSSPSIVLFGSYSKGEDTENSDIDLYVESPSKKKINLEQFEKILQRRIQLFNYRNIKEAVNKELANNIVNGITLNGFIEVF
ncbi:MAG TPA: nucleotidyltransferase domain-containing protein [Candidatus Nanoarchaeia archaeon]|nr:nucleotidyltransferase domain-containing protein [Candidatus Nanoarchaeia archaeon]